MYLFETSFICSAVKFHRCQLGPRVTPGRELLLCYYPLSRTRNFFANRESNEIRPSYPGTKHTLDLTAEIPGFLLGEMHRKVRMCKFTENWNISHKSSGLSAKCQSLRRTLGSELFSHFSRRKIQEAPRKNPGGKLPVFHAFRFFILGRGPLGSAPAPPLPAASTTCSMRYKFGINLVQVLLRLIIGSSLHFPGPFSTLCQIKMLCQWAPAATSR